METTPAVKLTIHRDVAPIVPEGFGMIKHFARDTEWELSKVKLVALPKELSESEDFFAIDEDGNFFNAAVVNTLVSSQKNIPDDWRTKNILFLDTVYSKNGMGRYVLCLQYSHRNGWHFRPRRCPIFLFDKVKELTVLHLGSLN